MSLSVLREWFWFYTFFFFFLIEDKRSFDETRNTFGVRDPLGPFES